MEDGMDLTFDRLLAIINLIIPVVYYCESTAVPLGKVIFVPSNKSLPAPAFYIVHPDDVDRLRSVLAGSVRLVQLREGKP